ncbi:MAG: OmpA family protein [Paracoccaceae bacterium]|nr:OmpA family protein [Paracoccaceae bacterium]
MFGKKAFATAVLIAQMALGGPAFADDSPFAGGWTLSEAGSNLHFISVKKGKIMESSSFAGLGGTIDEDGTAKFEIALDSIDTSVDLRNVRMRFLFFETFLHPKAVVSAQLTEDLLDGLEARGSIKKKLPFTLDLHGMTKSLEAEVIVTMIGQNRVSVAAAQPVILKLEDFNLMEGRQKLQEAAEVEIVPATSVLFHLVFDRNDPLATSDGLLASVAAPEAAALEPVGNFDREACFGRFEILSRSGNVNFLPSSWDLTPESRPLLDDVARIISKCPGMILQVAGYTDSRGKAEYNMYLSEQRANAVVDYFVNAGISAERLLSKGYGESNPVATNNTVEGRKANRRIEFVLSDS